MSFVEIATRSASLRISSATTAKRRPASPAPAASMVALMARMLVCSASSLTTSTTPPICCDFRPSSSMWPTMRSTWRRMLPTVSWLRCTVASPERAAFAVSPATLATRWALSEIWREVASSSLMVVVISVIAVACSFAPVACWPAAACSSDEELWTWRTAVEIWRPRTRASRSESTAAAPTASAASSTTTRVARAASAVASSRSWASSRSSKERKARIEAFRVSRSGRTSRSRAAPVTCMDRSVALRAMIDSSPRWCASSASETVARSRFASSASMARRSSSMTARIFARVSRSASR